MKISNISTLSTIFGFQNRLGIFGDFLIFQSESPVWLTTLQVFRLDSKKRISQLSNPDKALPQSFLDSGNVFNNNFLKTNAPWQLQ